MKKVVRRALGESTLEHLAGQQTLVDAEPGSEARVAKAGALWKTKTQSKAAREAFVEVKRILADMCNGPELCMYCEASEAADIEHIRPRSRFPAEAFRWPNFLLACPLCNRFKRDRYREGFMDPSSPDYSLWSRWVFDPDTGHYHAAHVEDEGGAATLDILGFDQREMLARRRRDHLQTLLVGIREYAKERDRGHDDHARTIAQTFAQLFPAITEWLLVTDPSPEIFPGIETVRKVKSRFPEIVDDALG